MMLVKQLLGIVVPPSVTETCVMTSRCGVCVCDVCVCVCLFSFSEGVNFEKSQVSPLHHLRNNLGYPSDYLNCV